MSTMKKRTAVWSKEDGAWGRGVACRLSQAALLPFEAACLGCGSFIPLSLDFLVEPIHLSNRAVECEMQKR